MTRLSFFRPYLTTIDATVLSSSQKPQCVSASNASFIRHDNFPRSSGCSTVILTDSQPRGAFRPLTAFATAASHSSAFGERYHVPSGRRAFADEGGLPFAVILNFN